MLKLKEFVKQYVQEDKGIVNDGFEAYKAQQDAERSTSYEYSGDESEIVQKIIDLIETYVKPAVEMDGGNIEFKSFDKGKVTVSLQGACSGCPSSSVTLKAGIEGMLKRMIPEVTEVIADMD